MKFPLGAMTVGDILDRGLKLLFARLPVFYLINLLILSPLIALQLAFPFVVESVDFKDQGSILVFLGVWVFAILLALALQPIGTAAILHIVMEEYAGRRATLGAALSFALSRFGPLLLGSILYGLILVLGFVLCCVPMFVVLAIYSLYAQVIVLERLGAAESLGRSAELTRDYRWRVFGVLILILVANMVVQGMVGQVLAIALPPQQVIPAANGPRIEFDKVNYVINTAVTQLVSILMTTYLAVCTTLLYLDLRIRKEGFDLELAAQLGEEPDADGGPRSRRRDRDDEYDDRPRRRRPRDDDRDDEYDRPRGRRGQDDDWDYENDRPRRRAWDEDRDDPDDRPRDRRRDEDDRR